MINNSTEFIVLKEWLEPVSCYFCGESNLIVLEFSEGITDDKKYQVHCTCGADGPWGWSIEEAIGRWNKTEKTY